MGPETCKSPCIVSREAAEGEAGDRHGERRQQPEKHREAKEECVKSARRLVRAVSQLASGLYQRVSSKCPFSFF